MPLNYWFVIIFSRDVFTRCLGRTGGWQIRFNTICLVFALNVLPQHISCSWNCTTRNVILFIFSRVVFKGEQGFIWGWGRRDIDARFFFWQCLWYVFEVQKVSLIIETLFLKYSYTGVRQPLAVPQPLGVRQPLFFEVEDELQPEDDDPLQEVDAASLPKSKDKGKAPCDQCEMVCKTAFLLNRHKKARHGNDDEVSKDCPYCKKSFKSAATRKQHMKQCGTRPREACACSGACNCAIAEASSSTLSSSANNSSSARSRLRSNTNLSSALEECSISAPPSLRCNLCGKMLANATTLARHMTKMHEGLVFFSFFGQQYNNPFQGHITASTTLKGSSCSCLVFPAASVLHTELSWMHMDRQNQRRPHSTHAFKACRIDVMWHLCMWFFALSTMLTLGICNMCLFEQC